MPVHLSLEFQILMRDHGMVQFQSDVDFWNNQLFLGDPCHIKMWPLILHPCLWPFPKGREFCAKKLFLEVSATEEQESTGW